ncbi:MAG: GNAT family N-acetyltransferase [Phycisphaerae bacterium]
MSVRGVDVFRFLDPGDLVDGDLRLVLRETQSAVPSRGLVSAYVFDLTPADDPGLRMGYIALRVGHTDFLVRYAGHIGYRVEEPYRGHRYAGRACRLLLPLARRHGLDPLWITVNPDNIPSRRTCERIGAEMIEIVDVPRGCDMYKMGDRRKCRYRLRLDGSA